MFEARATGGLVWMNTLLKAFTQSQAAVDARQKQSYRSARLCSGPRETQATSVRKFRFSPIEGSHNDW